MACSSTKTAGARCSNCSCSNSSAAVVKLPSASASSKKARTGESTPLLWSTTPADAATYQATKSGASEDTSRHTNANSGSSSSSTVGLETECPATNPSCDHHDDPSFVCCREINASSTRTLIDPDFARDCIVGLSDGLTVPFALTAGLSSVGSSKLVVLAGLAELVSGAISMGIGGFLSAQAELSHYAYNLKSTQEKVSRSCPTEIQTQVKNILQTYGIADETCAKVAQELAHRENERRQLQEEHRQSLDAKQSRNRSSRRKLFGCLPLPSSSSASYSQLPVDEEIQSNTTKNDADDEDKEGMLGLTPFLLRVGEGLEPVSTSRLYISALTIGLSYFMGGIIPLLPYMFIEQAGKALLLSVIITGIILLIFGVVKQRFTGGEGGFKGYAYGAVSTLMVGGVAAGASWIIVGLLEGGGDGGGL